MHRVVWSITPLVTAVPRRTSWLAWVCLFLLQRGLSDRLWPGSPQRRSYRIGRNGVSCFFQIFSAKVAEHGVMLIWVICVLS
ncbi:hypothetical protein HDV57DRAFT_444043 [Trichoderma longibrachiatum]|uniref:Secreted protein n=1 Tax=Trichoderma longibrachiatum ATCC 18648 TaxID=983965 RepID=A0A2T4CG39_TRILO|nr:hypothetical protein M440DRAFT_196568 [Trichoderma longibrachiatum ATCC 18648]